LRQKIRRLQPSDQAEWLRMRLALWPESSKEELQAEMADILADPLQPVFVAEHAHGGLGGFVEVALHHEYTHGCKTSPVGYIEGWYVNPELRQQGLGGQLFQAAENWARAQGCREMASDCELENEISWKAHQALGYQEVLRLIHFRKEL
jgi:aminoglycoside 6'-N-acetyltransferase I